MKTIKELEKEIENLKRQEHEYLAVIQRAKLQTLKDILKLIDKLELNCPIQRGKECWCFPLWKLKSKIKGKEEK